MPTLRLYAVVVLALAGCGGGDPVVPPPPAQLPVPAISALSPATLSADTTDLALEVTGTGFVSATRAFAAGIERPTTVVNATTLRLVLERADVTNGGSVPITVRNPTPGGGTSNAVTLGIVSPTPLVTALSPSTIDYEVGGAPTFAVTGTGFSPSSSIRIGATAVPTTFVNRTTLQGAVPTALIANAGTFPVTVVNPAPGGGTAPAVSITIAPPLPRLTAFAPAALIAGGQASSVTVTGTGFAAGTQFHVNGQPRPTMVVSAVRASVMLTAADLAIPASVLELQASQGGAARTDSLHVPLIASAAATASTTLLNISVNDMVYDPGRVLIYATVSSTDATHPNTIAVIDPVGGRIVSTIPSREDPSVIALSEDGRYLYVAPRRRDRVERIDLVSGTDSATIPLPSYFPPLGVLANMIFPLPGAPKSFLVVTDLGCCSISDGLTVFDDRIARPMYVARVETTLMVPSVLPGRYIGIDTRSSAASMTEFVVSSSGVRLEREIPNVAEGRILAADRNLFVFSSGKVFDSRNLGQIGSFGTPGVETNSAIAVDVGNGRIVTYNGGENINIVEVFNYLTFTRIATFPIPADEGNVTFRRRLLRWGNDGVAINRARTLLIARSGAIGR